MANSLCTGPLTALEMTCRVPKMSTHTSSSDWGEEGHLGGGDNVYCFTSLAVIITLHDDDGFVTFVCSIRITIRNI